MATITEKRAAFRSLHESGCFAIPNPWDIGSARYLQHLGFKAIATTSAGFAFARGLPDNGVPRDIVLAHIRELVDATDVPVNADFENGFADEPNDIAENVRLCVETGVAGLPGRLRGRAGGRRRERAALPGDGHRGPFHRGFDR